MRAGFGLNGRLIICGSSLNFAFSWLGLGASTLCSVKGDAVRCFPWLLILCLLVFISSDSKKKFFK